MLSLGRSKTSSPLSALALTVQRATCNVQRATCNVQRATYPVVSNFRTKNR